MEGHWKKKKTSTFWDITPCSPVKLNQRFGGRLDACFMLVSCLAYSSTLKMEVTCSSGMSVDFHHNTWRYIPEDRTLQSHCCENLKSCICLMLASGGMITNGEKCQYFSYNQILPILHI
jgi:hypothetical protein